MNRSGPIAARQHGVALAVVLLLLLLMALLATATMSEHRAEAQAVFVAADHTRTLEAADSALAAGERWLTLLTTKPEAMVGCVSPCGAVNLVWSGNPAQISNWSQFDWTDNARQFGVAYPIPGTELPATDSATTVLAHILVPPGYVIEEIGYDPNSADADAPGGYSAWYYRITACAHGASPKLRVLTQSIFLKRFETASAPTSNRAGRLTWHELGGST